MSQTFGCCAYYKECSDKGTCLFPNDEIHSGCYYAKNLAAGKNFYSDKVKKQKKDFEIFLDCYDRNFKISRRSRNGCSYSLSEEEYNALRKVLTDESIPFVDATDKAKCIMEGNSEEPANSRVEFSVPGIDKIFVIGNFNQCLVLKRYSDGIEKSLKLKGIEAKTELTGSYSHRKEYLPKVKKEKIKEVIKAEIQKEKKIECKQMSIFDLLGA